MRILAIGPAWVGDMVLSQSLFKLLVARRPGIEIDVAAPAWTIPLLARMPEVRKAIPLPFRHGALDLAGRFRTGRQLRVEGYAQAILLTNSLKSAILPLAAGIPRRTGYRGEMRYGLVNDIRTLDKTALPMTVQRFAALGLEPGEPLPQALPQPLLSASPENARQLLAQWGYVDGEKPVLGLCPGAEYGPAKRWPATHYAEVASWALDRGHAVWLFGSEKDAGVTGTIQQATGGRCLDLGGKTSLGDAVDLLSLTTAVVSNDSGLMHVAAAVGRPLVAVYGSSDPAHTPPMSAQARIVRLDLPCSPCFSRECPLGHLDCLNRIPAGQVIQTLQDQL